MKISRFVHLILSPGSPREIACVRTGFAAVIINAVSGMILVCVPVISLLLPLCTITLAAFLVILFGPLIGFICSSVYSRLEWFAGRRLGGKASLDDLYRIFAWSFLPMSLALLLYQLLCLFMDSFQVPMETVTMIAAAIPSLFIAYCSLRDYCSNVVAVQQFTQIRGIVSIVLTFALFLTVTLAAVVLLWLLSEHGMSEDLKQML